MRAVLLLAATVRAARPGGDGLPHLPGVAPPAALEVAPSPARSNRRGRIELDTPGAHRSLTTLTAIIGTTLLADAAAQIILAFTVSPTTFGVVARIASWVIVATGLAVYALCVRRLRARPQDQAESQPSPPS